MDKPQTNTCQYVDTHGKQCDEVELGNGMCFWHDKDIDKEGVKLAHKLQEFASGGGVTQGICLQRADLEDVRLVNYGHKEGYDFSNADFYRANMRNAHLFNANFENASLMKARLYDADLHCSKLHNCNLLDVKLRGARLDNLSLGNHVYQETVAAEAERAGDIEKAIDFYEQSEETYRVFRKAAAEDGLTNLVGEFAYKELTMKRKQMPKWSIERVGSKFVDVFCGYGEKPFNVILFSLMLIFVCAVFYFLLGVNSADGIVRFSAENDLYTNIRSFGATIYFSVVTFTTLGYGDITPYGFARVIATLEAFIGSFALALYVVVFVKKTSR
jgi:hypothetical protein